MLYKVQHVTRHRYSRPVFLEPHTLRVRPRNDGSQRVSRFELEIDPEPAGIDHCLDAEGNAVVETWFEGLTDHLTVTTRFEAETLRKNPFGFLVDPSALNVPFDYSERLRGLLQTYLIRSRSDGPVADFARSVLEETGAATLAFLAGLSRRIHQTCEGVVRERGPPHSPEVTLETRSGSCRDLAVLFVEACRHAGLAARFVTGYQGDESKDGRRHLHAWAEVYIPRGGWRGFDPSLGLTVADRHVVLAAAAEPAGAAILSGTLRGTGASSEMSAEIEIRLQDGSEGTRWKASGTRSRNS